jgi:hypothetical protein
LPSEGKIAMSDNLTNRIQPDRSKINMHEDHEGQILEPRARRIKGSAARAVDKSATRPRGPQGLGLQEPSKSDRPQSKIQCVLERRSQTELRSVSGEHRRGSRSDRLYAGGLNPAMQANYSCKRRFRLRAFRKTSSRRARRKHFACSRKRWASSARRCSSVLDWLNDAASAWRCSLVGVGRERNGVLITDESH